MTLATTPKFGISLMATGSLQKELIFNEATILLEVLTARSVKSKALYEPPANPVAGDTYLIADPTPIGDWAGKSGQLAFYYNGWRFITPPAKMKVWDEHTSTWCTYSEGSWITDAVSAVHTLDDLSDVTIGTPLDGQVLAYDVATHQWKPKAGSTVVNFDDLADVDTTGLQNGQVFVWDAAAGKLKPGSLPVFPTVVTYDHLSQLTDVDLSGLVDGNMLVWNGTKWHPGNASMASINDVNDVVTTGAAVGDVLAWNGSAWGPSSQALPLSFLNVIDGPRTFTGAGHKLLRVDATESELEYVDPAEVGVPSGGTVGQVLMKTATGSTWSDTVVPIGGTAGQVLTKQSSADGDAAWLNPTGGGGSSSSGIDTGAHAYWRIRILSGFSTGWYTFYELVFANAPFGTSLASGGTAIAGGGNPTLAFDGSTSSRWAKVPANDTTDWIGYHFTTAVNVTEVRLQCSYVTGEMVKSWVLEYSDDGALWYSVKTYTDANGWYDGEWRAYAVPPLGTSIDALADVDITSATPVDGQVLVWDAIKGRVVPGTIFGGVSKKQKHRWWRIRVLTGWSTGWVTFGDISFHASLTGAALTTGGYTLTGNGGDATKAFDGLSDADHRYGIEVSYIASGQCWVGYCLSAEAEVRVVKLTSSGWTEEMPKSWVLEYSEDGATWYTAQTFTDTVAWTAMGEVRSYTVTAYEVATGIDALADVDVSTLPPADGQALVYDATSSLWKPGTVAASGGGSASSGGVSYTLFDMAPPTVDFFSTAFGAATIGAAADTALLMTAAATGGYAVHGRARPAPSGSFDLIARVCPEFLGQDAGAGICFIDASGKILNFFSGENGTQNHTVNIQYWDSPTVPGSGGSVTPLPGLGPIEWLRMSYNSVSGTTTFMVSKNKTAWRTIGTASSFVPASVGISVMTAPAVSAAASFRFYSDGVKSGIPVAIGGSDATTNEPHRAHRAWRVLMLNTLEYPTLDAGGYATIGELSFWDRSGAQIATSGGIASGFNINSSYPLANAFDGSATTLCSSSAPLSNTQRMAVGYVFASAVDVGSIKVTAANGYLTHMPRDFSVQYSDDLGGEWHTFATFTDTVAWTASEQRTYTLGASGLAVIGAGGVGGVTLDATLTTPVPSSFTNGPGLTATSHIESSLKGMRVRDFNTTGNSNKLTYAYQPPAGAHWMVSGKFRRGPMTSYMAWGIVLADSVSGRHLIFGPKYEAGGVGRIKFNTYNSYAAQETWTADVQPHEFWLRVYYDGTNLVYQSSTDGDFWTTLKSEVATTWLTNAVDRVGFGINCNHAGSDTIEPMVDCLSWAHVAI